MIRLTLITLFVTFFTVYAWKDWYVSLCGLIVFMAVFAHPDMPRAMFNISGMNPWNFLLANILMGCMLKWRVEKLKIDCPRLIFFLAFIYFMVIVLGYLRLLADKDSMVLFGIGRGSSDSFGDITNEYLLNSLKWVIPGILVFIGCRTQSRFELTIISICLFFFLIGAQVIKEIPFSYALSGENLELRTRSILRKTIGYHRTDISLMLAGGSWAIFALKELFPKDKLKQNIIIACSGLTVLAMLLTAGRGGYLSWVAVALCVCYFRWKKYIILIPLVLIVFMTVAPGIVDRVFEGLPNKNKNTITGSMGHRKTDMTKLTAGRNLAWPYVIEGIEESPLVGHGRLAMRRIGIVSKLYYKYGDIMPHPHNAYLQLLLDAGILGAVPIILLFMILIKYSISLFKDKRRQEYLVTGGVCFSILFSFLVGSFTGQSFYPREVNVGMWCCVGLLLRIYIMRQKLDVEEATKSVA